MPEKPSLKNEEHAARPEPEPGPPRLRAPATLVDDLLAGPAWDDELAEAATTRPRAPQRDAIH